MLRPDQRRSKDVMDAAIEDRDRRPVDRLGVHDAGEVRAGRPDQEAPGLEQEPRLGEQWVVRPAVDDAGQAATEPDQVERLLVRLVRDAQAAPGVDDPDRGAAQSRELAGGPGRRRGVGHERAGLEDVGRPEGMESEQLEVRRSGGQPGGIHEVGGVHPELARAVVTDQADTLEPRALGHGRPQQHGLAPTCRSSDALEPSELAERLDRHRPDPGRDGRLAARRRACPVRS